MLRKTNQTKIVSMRRSESIEQLRSKVRECVALGHGCGALGHGCGARDVTAARRDSDAIAVLMPIAGRGRFVAGVGGRG
jgi:predicted RNA methylase